MYQEKRINEIEVDLKHILSSEISRHLKRLIKKHLVVKDVNNRYGISNIGKILYKIMEIFEVSLKNKDFLNSHDIPSIPIL